MTALGQATGATKQAPYFKSGGINIKERSASAMAMQGANGE